MMMMMMMMDGSSSDDDDGKNLQSADGVLPCELWTRILVGKDSVVHVADRFIVRAVCRMWAHIVDAAPPTFSGWPWVAHYRVDPHRWARGHVVLASRLTALLDGSDPASVFASHFGHALPLPDVVMAVTRSPAFVDLVRALDRACNRRYDQHAVEITLSSCPRLLCDLAVIAGDGVEARVAVAFALNSIVRRDDDVAFAALRASQAADERMCHRTFSIVSLGDRLFSCCRSVVERMEFGDLCRAREANRASARGLNEVRKRAHYLDGYRSKRPRTDVGPRHDNPIVRIEPLGNAGRQAALGAHILDRIKRDSWMRSVDALCWLCEDPVRYDPAASDAQPPPASILAALVAAGSAESAVWVCARWPAATVRMTSHTAVDIVRLVLDTLTDERLDKRDYDYALDVRETLTNVECLVGALDAAIQRTATITPSDMMGTVPRIDLWSLAWDHFSASPETRRLSAAVMRRGWARVRGERSGDDDAIRARLLYEVHRLPWLAVWPDAAAWRRSCHPCPVRWPGGLLDVDGMWSWLDERGLLLRSP